MATVFTLIIALWVIVEIVAITKWAISKFKGVE